MADNSSAFIYVGLGSEGKGPNGHGLYRRSVNDGPWEQMANGLPEIAMIRTITIDPEDPATIYVGTQNGAYISYDRGDSWKQLDLPGESVPIWSVNFHPTNPKIIFAGGEDARLWRSKDSGKSWNIIRIDVIYPSVTTSPKLKSKRILDVAVDSNLPNEIYASIEVGGVIRSRDNGDTWEGISEGYYHNDDPVDCHGVLVSSAHPRHVSVISRAGLYRSEDGGDHWSWGNIKRIGTSGTYSRVIREVPGDPSTLYLGTGPQFRGDHGELLRSHDYGSSWELVDMGIVPNCTLFGVSINPRDPSQIYCATRHAQVLGSHDGGDTWHDCSLPDDLSEVNSLAVG
ncbi:hypothetical protein FIM12_04200 [SAR202 cluster bacterium AD-804-J14_MRT_500m]|nr:hypothetical protein [SAR202 cluster bacterium AD-804-J14_MRT_500m]